MAECRDARGKGFGHRPREKLRARCVSNSTVRSPLLDRSACSAAKYYAADLIVRHFNILKDARTALVYPQPVEAGAGVLADRVGFVVVRVHLGGSLSTVGCGSGLNAVPGADATGMHLIKAKGGKEKQRSEQPIGDGRTELDVLICVHERPSNANRRLQCRNRLWSSKVR